jgi:hypothetical protein
VRSFEVRLAEQARVVDLQAAVHDHLQTGCFAIEGYLLMPQALL